MDRGRGVHVMMTIVLPEQGRLLAHRGGGGSSERVTTCVA